MKTAPPLRSSKRKGLSLLELTVVIAVLLSLTTVLMLGARAWKNGSDVSSLAGKPVRLRFRLKDADLFAFQFIK